MPEARRLRGAALLVVPVLGALVTAGPSTAAAVPSYQGTAAANGVQLRVQVPALSGLTDVPVDGGGPTAQAVAGSLGSGSGYAAFPDPGQFVVSVPGLLAGLTAGQVPSLPPYPFFVQSDAVTAPEAVLGEGPYRLRATSATGAATASALAGFEVSGAGNAALVRSTASVGPDDHGDGAAARSALEVEGMTIGPVTLGRIRSTAEMAVDVTGTVHRTSSLRISGAEIAGLPIGLSDRGLEVGGTDAPLPLEQVLAPALAPLGIGLRVVAAQHLDDVVVAPALELTLPVPAIDVPGVATVSAIVTVRIGATSASLVGAASAPNDPPPTDDTPSALSLPEGVASPPLPPVTTPVAATVPASPEAIARRSGLLDQWDVSVLYLFLLGGAVLVPLAGEAIRRRGVSA